MKSFRGRPSTGRHRSRGQAVVEFALILPLFLLLLAGMIDFGMGLHDYMVIISAARDGARLGATACGTDTPPCSATITTRVNAAVGGLAIDPVTPACAKPDNTPLTTCDSGEAKAGGSVTVTVSYTYHMIWPLAFGTQIPMGYTAKFMVQ
jgi:Flp pilus assembly protein TadG